MLPAKIAIWAGAIIALFGTTLPTHIFYRLGMREFPEYENNYFAIVIGLCLLVGGLVAYGYEDKNSN
jgi:hypothetical protein